MNAKLNRERMIVHPNDLVQRELPELLFGAISREPASEDPFVEEIGDALHGGLALVLHGLVVVGADEESSGAVAGIEEGALEDKGEEPVAVLKVVAVHQFSHLASVEGDGVGELRGGVAQAGEGAEKGGWGCAAEEVVGEDLGAAGDAVVVRHGGGVWEMVRRKDAKWNEKVVFGILLVRQL